MEYKSSNKKITHNFEKAKKIIYEQRDELVEAEKTFDGLETQMDEFKRTEYDFIYQLYGKDEICKKKELEIF